MGSSHFSCTSMVQKKHKFTRRAYNSHLRPQAASHVRMYNVYIYTYLCVCNYINWIYIYSYLYIIASYIAIFVQLETQLVCDSRTVLMPSSSATPAHKAENGCRKEHFYPHNAPHKAQKHAPTLQQREVVAFAPTCNGADCPRRHLGRGK